MTNRTSRASAPENIDNPARPIVEVLKETGRGGAMRDASHLLREVTTAVQDTGKAGTVTLVLKVEKSKKGGVMFVTASASAKIPALDDEASTFFVDPNGDLTRHDPNQLSLIAERSSTIDPDAVPGRTGRDRTTPDNPHTTERD